MRFDHDRQFLLIEFLTRLMSCEAWRRELRIAWCISGGLHSSMIARVRLLVIFRYWCSVNRHISHLTVLHQISCEHEGVGEVPA